MAYPAVYPPATEQIQQVTALTAGNTTCTASIPDGVAPNQLIVINWIKFSGQSSAATPAFTCSVNGVIIARRTMTQAVADEVFNLQFSAGFPQWAVAGSDFLQATGVNVVVVGPATVSTNTLTVGYCYVPVSSMRV
jgi:hypothetical protein